MGLMRPRPAKHNSRATDQKQILLDAASSPAEGIIRLADLPVRRLMDDFQVVVQLPPDTDGDALRSAVLRAVVREAYQAIVQKLGECCWDDDVHRVARAVCDAVQTSLVRSGIIVDTHDVMQMLAAHFGVILMPGQKLVTVSMTVGTEDGHGSVDGAAAEARFGVILSMLRLPDGRVLMADSYRIRMLSADLQHVSAVAGDGESGHRDGAVAQVQFGCVGRMIHLPDGRVLVADSGRIRMLSADLQHVSTVAGDGDEGHRDGAAAQAQFCAPTGFAVLPDGRVLVTDTGNHRIRMLSADLQQVSTVAGDGELGRYDLGAYRDGAAVQARFYGPTGLVGLPDGRVLVADWNNHRIRMLSADLQQVSTVAGDGEEGHRDGAAAQARFNRPRDFALLPDGRVLVADENGMRVLSADLQGMSTLALDGVNHAQCAAALPDDRVLVAGYSHIYVLEGFLPASWLRRRTLLLCLNRGIESAPPADATGDVLLRVATLPEVLWKGPLIFQYL
jgi:hypothetical protein